MPMQLGEIDKLPCPLEIGGKPCLGSMVGTFGGKFRRQFRCGCEHEIAQYRGCKCSQCRSERVEIFEHFCDRCGYGVTEKLCVEDASSDDTFCWEGFGLPVAEIHDVDAYLSDAIAQAKIRVAQLVQQSKSERN